MTDLHQSLEALEHDRWDEPAFPSYIVKTCHRARKKPLCDLTHEELRCLIGQKIGLRYLLPIAVTVLQQEPLLEVTYFPGDLLLVLLRLEPGDWADVPDALRQFAALIQANRAQIDACEDIPHSLTDKY